MRKHLLLLIIISSIFILSCSKDLEDRVIGNWQLEGAWRQRAFGRDYFTTGYENGIFTFMDNGNATYVSSTDTLNGNWRSYRETRGYYNSSGDWESRSMKVLEIHLVNFQQNQWLEWDFDDFSFRNNWQTIRAEQYSLSNDRIYEFRRR